MEHKTESLKMLCSGMVLSLVNNLKVPAKFNFLQNIRVMMDGVLESRPRVDNFLFLNIAELSVGHTIKTILNEANDTKLRILGIGNKLYTGSGVILNQKSLGYSGKPLSIVDFRPEAAIQSYAYIADELKMEKIGVDDVLSSIGLISPRLPATFKIGQPQTKIIDECGDATLASWIAAGSASAPITVDRTNKTITEFIADETIPGFASIVPSTFTNDIQEGEVLLLDGTDVVTVEEVLAASIGIGVATIASISYESGVNGKCTIVLSISSQDIKPNSILLLNGTEYVRVISVTYDNNNIPSIKTSTTGTFSVGNSVSGAASFRFYATSTYTASDTIFTKAIRSTIGAAGISSLTRTFNVDLTNTGTTELTEDAIFHMSMIADPSKITEIQIQLDVDASVNDFTRNFFSYVLNPNFFTGSSTQTIPTISVIQQSIQRQQLIQQASNIYSHILRNSESGGYDPGVSLEQIIENLSGGSTTQTVLGELQWTEARISLKDFRRTGSDQSRTKRDVKAIRISVTATDAFDLSFDSIWVGRASDLDSNRANNFLPYNYVWRVRDPATKNVSNWSPPLRNGIRTNRTRIELNFPNATVDYPAAYKIDVARFGGTINDFRLVGSVKNDGSAFIDESSDRVIADNERASRPSQGSSGAAIFDFHQPFAILDTPKVGVCNVVGTEVTRVSGDNFNITWPRGTLILINGIANSLYTRPEDNQKLSLEKDVGSLSSATFELIDPLITGQPLPIMFGPFGEGNTGLIIFGAGDENAAGTLYWLDGNSPDTMSDLNRLEITSPSEPIMAGVIYDNYGFVFTTRRNFTLLPTYQSGRLQFIARRNANSRGVFCRTGLCVGSDFIYQISENADGIYKSQGGGNPASITDNSIRNLFMQSGVAPEPVVLIDGTIIYPPDFTKPDDIRLCYIKDFLMFRFIDTNNKQVAIAYNEVFENWISYDKYVDDKVGTFYFEELPNESSVLIGLENGVGKFADSGTREDTVESIVLPFAFDGGDSRLIKQFDEIMIDVNPTSDGMRYTNLFDNGTIVHTEETLIGTNREQFIHALQSGNGQLAKNITTIFKWLIKSGVKLYEEQFAVLIKGTIIDDRPTDWEDLGSLDLKLWQGVTVDADTFGVDKILKYVDDFGIVKASITINHPSQMAKDYSFDVPFISHRIKQISDDGIEWMPLNTKFIADLEPHTGMVWEGEISTETINGLITTKRVGLAYRALESSADVTFKISTDGIEESILFPKANLGVYTKHYEYVTAKKGTHIKWRIEASNNIQVFLKDCEVWMGQWCGQKQMAAAKPFGGNSRITQAQI